MKEQLVIEIRGKESCESLVRKGWESLFAYTTLAEYELESIATFNDQIILYLEPTTGEEEESHGNTTEIKYTERPRGIYISKVSTHKKQ